MDLHRLPFCLSFAMDQSHVHITVNKQFYGEIKYRTFSFFLNIIANIQLKCTEFPNRVEKNTVLQYIQKNIDFETRANLNGIQC